MYYEPGKTPHGLPYDPFKSCVIPRPIGWIATVSRDGLHNLAAFGVQPVLIFERHQFVQGSGGSELFELRLVSKNGSLVRLRQPLVVSERDVLIGVLQS